ncbi:MAG: N-6 DNA methylase [candidate division WOR-3 bacterium]
MEPRFLKAYEMLFANFGESEFTYEDAESVLGKDFANIREVISQLKREKLIKYLGRYENDNRIKRFKLVPLAKVVNSRGELISILKQSADLIRTRVDYRVLLILLFYKSISDKWYKTVEYYKRQGYNENTAKDLADADVLRLRDKNGDEITWHSAGNNSQKLVENLSKLEDLNGDELKGFKSLLQITQIADLVNNSGNISIFSQIIQLFGNIDFSNYPYDVLGDGYEWILGYFAPQKAKEGEVYTPKEVSRLLAEILDPETNYDILDPASGSGSLLIEMYKKMAEKGEPNGMLYGQEVNSVMAIISRLNFKLHNITNFKIYEGDSLLSPQFEHADIVVANPPWNQDGYNEKNLGNIRDIYYYGFTNKKSADWAWIQLITYYAKKRAGVIIDTGALTRGGREGKIRRKFIESGIIDAVILLPEKLFYNTQAPACIIIFNKEKPKDKNDKILFINASYLYKSHPDVKKLNILGEDNIEEIVDAYNGYYEGRELPEFARVVSIDEIANNNYNLNVSLYVHLGEENERVDIFEEFMNLMSLNEEYEALFNRISGYMEEIKKLEGEI